MKIIIEQKEMIMSRRSKEEMQEFYSNKVKLLDEKTYDNFKEVCKTMDIKYVGGNKKKRVIG